MTHISDSIAGYIDTLRKERSDTFSGFFLSQVVTRLATVLFALTSLVDSITLAGKAGVTWIRSFGDAEYLKTAEKAGVSARRHLEASVTSLISDLYAPGTVSHHFIPEQPAAEGTVTPYGQLYTEEADIRKPCTISALRKIVKEAYRTGKKVAILGAGFSQGKQAIPGDKGCILIDMRLMNSVDIIPGRKRAWVGAGATWHDVQKNASPHGLSVQTMQASNVFSVGGSLGINCHGWDIRSGTVGNTVKSLTVIDGKGMIRHLRPEDPLFQHVIGGLGQFGIIANVELELTDNVVLKREGKTVPLMRYVEEFDKILADPKAGDMHLASLNLTPSSLFEGEVVMETYTKVDESAVPVKQDMASIPEENAVEKVLLGYARERGYVRALGWEAKKKLLLTPKEATRNEHMFFPIQSMFNNSKSKADWLQEYFVPKEELVNFVGYLGKILKKNNVALFNASIRYVPQDSSTKLAYAKDTPMFAIVLCFSQSLAQNEIDKTEKWVRKVNNYLLGHKGTFYLPYMQFATQGQFEKAYPQWKAAVDFKHAVDPKGIFQSGFTSEYLNVKEDAPIIADAFIDTTIERRPGGVSLDREYYRDLFSSSETREDLSKFFDVIFKHADKERFFELVDTILRTNRTDKAVYEALSTRFHECQFGPMMTAVSTMKTLKNQVSALGEQFEQLMPKDREIDGYVSVDDLRFIREIGKRRTLKGNVTHINPNRESEERSVKDIVEGGIFSPYTQVLNQKSYAPLTEEEVASESIELVTAMKGLHHIDKETLSPFLRSMHRVLKDGGSFFLREHDVTSERVRRAATFAHTVVNASDGDSFETEMKEVRNFRSMYEWIEIMQEHGFVLKNGGTIRDGDPTENTLMRFEKVGKSSEAYSLEDAREIAHRRERYEGNQIGMTFQAAEWQNVLSAEQYAAFIKESPFSEFPFMKHIQEFWKVFHAAFATEMQNHSFGEIVSTFYFWMIIFVGTTMTIEYAVKAGLGSIMNLLLKRNGGDGTFEGWKEQSQHSADEYATFVRHSPFYEFPFMEHIKAFWETFSKDLQSDFEERAGIEIITKLSFWMNILIGVGFTMDYGIKGAISALMLAVFGPSPDARPLPIQLLIEDPENEALSIDPTAKILDRIGKFTRIEVRRFDELTSFTTKAVEKGIVLHELAGETKTQLRLQLPLDKNLEDIEGLEVLFGWNNFQEGMKLAQVNIELSKLKAIQEELARREIETIFMHDF